MTDSSNTRNQGLSITALSLSDTAKLLTKSAGKPVSVDMLKEDIEAGAPTNADGTMNLIYYAAWLVKGLGHGD